MNDKQLTTICLGYERDNSATCAKVLEYMYLDFVSDMLTTEQLAEHAELGLDLLEHALSLGRTYNQLESEG